MPLNQKDTKLYNAIRGNQALNTMKALQEGANVFAEIEIVIAGEKRRSSLLGLALFSNCEAVVDAILENCQSIDISKPFDIKDLANVQSVHPINLLQFAFVYCTNPIIESLITYATTNGRHADIPAVLNKRFYRPGTQKLTTVASEIVLTFSTHMLINSHHILSASIDSKKADKDVVEWMWLKENEKATFEAHATEIELEVNFGKKLESLLAKGFNHNLIDCFGFNLTQLIRLIIKCSTNPQIWEEELLPKITFSGIKKIGSARLNPDQTEISIPVELSNIHTTNIRRATLTQNVKKLKAVYAAFLKAQKEKALQAPSLALVTEVKGLHAKVDEISADLHALADQRLKDVQEQLSEFPTAKTCFDTLQRHLESSLTLECMAATGMIALTPSKLVQHEQNADLAMSMLKTTLTALNVAAQFSPVPFVGIIPMVLERLVVLAQKTRAAAKSKGVFNATLGMDLKGISIDVAAIVAAEAYLTHKGALNTGVINTLVSDVVKQLKVLKDAEIIDEAHLVGFLAQTAITRLRETRAANAAKLAHGTTALVPSFAIHVDEETTAHRPVAPMPPVRKDKHTPAKAVTGSTALVPSFARLSDEEEALRRAAAPSFSSTVTHVLFGGDGSPKVSKHSGSDSSATARSPAKRSGDRSGSGSHHGSNSSPTAPAPACCVTM